MKTSSIKRKLEPQEPKSRLGALVADRTSCARSAQITEHRFTKAGRLRQRPADRKKCRLSQVEEGPPRIVPRLPNSGSGRASGRELDFPRPPDLGGSHRGRTKSGHVALKGFLILCSVPRSTAKRFRFVRLGPQAIGSGKGSLEFRAV
jgi:hypothetical protein